jgi:ubiquinone/menaquinone biosynthesis C-methylase UbiE
MISYTGRHGELYDLFYADKPYATEAAFVHSCLEAYGLPGGKSLLELACGTGIHALAMEKLGYRVLATDNSQAMLAVATRKAKEALSGARFRNQDMTALDHASQL